MKKHNIFKKGCNEMKKIVSFIICAALVLALSASAFAYWQNISVIGDGYVCGDNVNLRSSMDTSSGENIGGQVNWYDSYYLRSISGSWGRVYMRSGNCEKMGGYVSSTYLNTENTYPATTVRVEFIY